MLARDMIRKLGGKYDGQITNASVPPPSSLANLGYFDNENP